MGSRSKRFIYFALYFLPFTKNVSKNIFPNTSLWLKRGGKLPCTRKISNFHDRRDESSRDVFLKKKKKKRRSDTDAGRVERYCLKPKTLVVLIADSTKPAAEK